jgi:hypothetical protein
MRSGTKLPIWDVRATVATGGNPDMTREPNSVVNDPSRRPLEQLLARSAGADKRLRQALRHTQIQI